LGNFRHIYPFLGCEKYDEFFHQNQSSLFLDTAASRAREECARMHREELEVFIPHFLFMYTELMPEWKEEYNMVSLFTFCVTCDKGYKYSSFISEEF